MRLFYSTTGAFLLFAVTSLLIELPLWAYIIAFTAAIGAVSVAYVALGRRVYRQRKSLVRLTLLTRIANEVPPHAWPPEIIEEMAVVRAHQLLREHDDRNPRD
jgi:hypothetical protein